MPRIGEYCVLVTLLGDLPSWLNLDVARNAAVGLAVAGTILLVSSMFLLRMIALRVVSIVILGCAVVGLLHYRSVLDHCDTHSCACTLFGQELKGGGCKQ